MFIGQVPVVIAIDEFDEGSEITLVDLPLLCAVALVQWPERSAFLVAEHHLLAQDLPEFLVDQRLGLADFFTDAGAILRVCRQGDGDPKQQQRKHTTDLVAHDIRLRYL